MNTLKFNIEDAQRIGDDLEKAYPAIDEPFPHIDPQHVEALADEITNVVSEILQSFLHAGSERDATNEEIRPAIETLVRSWSDVS